MWCFGSVELQNFSNLVLQQHRITNSFLCHTKVKLRIIFLLNHQLVQQLIHLRLLCRQKSLEDPPNKEVMKLVANSLGHEIVFKKLKMVFDGVPTFKQSS